MGAVLGTGLVIVILAAIVSAIIYSMVKDKKNGKSSCGGVCSHCQNSCACHGAMAQNKKKPHNGK